MDDGWFGVLDVDRGNDTDGRLDAVGTRRPDGAGC